MSSALSGRRTDRPCRVVAAGATAALLCLGVALAPAVTADETCQSPYMPKLVGQEDFVYVWTLGIDGVGDGSDKLVTIGANPAREGYGEVVASVSVGGRHEAHHGGFTDDRTQFWAGGLSDSKIFIFDVATDPANPTVAGQIDDFVEKSGGVVGPHTFYALPGRMMITGLSNATDYGGKTGIAEFSNKGEFIRTTWMPDGAVYGYDARVNARMNRMLSSSFTGHRNYMRDLRELMGDGEAMKDFGNTVVVWDHHARKPLQVLEVPGAPLEIRWALGPRHDYAFTTTALTSKLWGIFRTDDGTFEAVELADVGDPSKLPLPVDISLSSDDRYLFVDSFMDGTVRVFDVSNPRKPKVVLEKQIGSQVNMVSQTWDGERLYFASSLLAGWDKPGDADEQYVKAYSWKKEKLEPLFEIDFRAAGLGRPHLMRFGSVDFYRGRVAGAPAVAGSSGGGE